MELMAYAVTSTPVSILRCPYVKMATKNNLPSPKVPPWSSNATMRSEGVLYVWADGAHTRRLGNRLFNYASTYGIAWHNGHVPLLQDPGNVSQQYDLTRFFNLRMLTDEDNRITQVKVRSSSSILPPLCIHLTIV